MGCFPHFSDDSYRFVEKAASRGCIIALFRVFHAGAFSCHSHVLARAAECDNVNGRYLPAIHLRHVSKMLHLDRKSVV